MSGRSVNQTILFLDRLRPISQAVNQYFVHILSPVTYNWPSWSAEWETKVCGRTRYRSRDLWFMSQMHYRLRYAARRKTAPAYTISCPGAFGPGELKNQKGKIWKLRKGGSHSCSCTSPWSNTYSYQIPWRAHECFAGWRMDITMT